MVLDRMGMGTRLRMLGLLGMRIWLRVRRRLGMLLRVRRSLRMLLWMG